MNPTLRWGLIGPGGIAHRFADALGTRSDAHLHAVLGRSPERARAFAERWGAQVHADLPTFLADPDIDAVYIATPHSEHAAFADACLRAGRAVLCEKPLAANAAQATALITLARERGVFLMEALWTRYLPALLTAEAWLQQGRIGRVHSLQSSFGFHRPFDAHHRIFAPALAGGALLDIGIYNLSLSQWVMALQGVHDSPRLQAVGVLAPTGVEQRCAVNLQYSDGTVSQFCCAVDSVLDNRLHIGGERGHITLGPECWGPTEATLALHGEPPQSVCTPFAHNGFEYQIDAAMTALRAGSLEEPRIPHAQTLAVLQQIDGLRRHLGTAPFPFEGAGAA